MQESAERGREFAVRPIGMIARPGSDATPGAFFDPDQESVIVIDPIWESALTGIEEYSHLVVLFWLDRAERAESAPELFQPDGRDDLPSVGLFATRTPRRPNPIGMACPRLIRRDGNRLVVCGIDAWSFDRPLAYMKEDLKAGNREAFLPAHRVGREREYCHIEKLANLDLLPTPHGFQVAVFPIKIARASGGWVRAVALVGR